MYPGLILLCALGNLHVSWTIWTIYLHVFDYQNVETDVLLSWFFGVAGGAILGTSLNASRSKILIYVREIAYQKKHFVHNLMILYLYGFQYSIAVALIPVSALFVLHQTFSYNLLLVGRAFAGILYGVTLVTLILHIADNSSQFMRRHFMLTISAINLLPTILLAEIISTATGFWDVNASIGVIMFALAIFTLIFMPCAYESIVFLLSNGIDLRALENMLKLRNESRHYIRRDFKEFKMMLVEDYSDGGNIFSNGNSRPLFLILLLRLLNVLLTSNCVHWIFLANVWFDYQHWMRPTNLSAQMMDVVQDVFELNTNENLTFLFNDTDINQNNDSYDEPIYPLDVSTITPNETDEYFSSGNSNILSTTEIPFDLLSSNEADIGVPLLANVSGILTSNVSSIANHLFIHSAYSYRLPPLQIAQFILIVSIIKILFGVSFMYLAEKFQVYRNRIIFKVTLCIGVINLIFFMATLVCNITDDSLLFTFYIAKLLSVIYGFYLLIAFSIDSVGYCELAETFSLSKRYGSIAFIVICEYLFHAIAILLIMNALFRFYFHVVQSVVICFICYLLLKRMPNECLNCTLRSARDKHFVKMATSNN